MNDQVRDGVGVFLLCLIAGGTTVSALSLYGFRADQMRAADAASVSAKTLAKTQADALDVQKAIRVVAEREPHARAGLKSFMYECSATAAQGECFITNASDEPAVACVRLTIHRAGSSATVSPIPICTGEMKPKSSQTLASPFAIGAIRGLCPGDGYSGVSWEKCTLSVDDVTDSPGRR